MNKNQRDIKMSRYTDAQILELAQQLVEAHRPFEAADLLKYAVDSGRADLRKPAKEQMERVNGLDDAREKLLRDAAVQTAEQPLLAVNGARHLWEARRYADFVVVAPAAAATWPEQLGNDLVKGLEEKREAVAKAREQISRCSQAASAGDRGATRMVVALHTSIGEFETAEAWIEHDREASSPLQNAELRTTYLMARGKFWEASRTGRAALDQAGERPSREAEAAPLLANIARSEYSGGDLVAAVESGLRTPGGRLWAVRALLDMGDEDRLRRECADAARAEDPTLYEVAANVLAERGRHLEAGYFRDVHSLRAATAGFTRPQAGKVGVDATVASSSERSTGGPHQPLPSRKPAVVMRGRANNGRNLGGPSLGRG